MSDGNYEAYELSSEGSDGYPLLIKVLACGYGGPNDITGVYFPSASERERYIYTHIAAGYAYVSNAGVQTHVTDITGLSNEDFEACGLGDFVRAAWNTDYKGTVKVVKVDGYQDLGYLASYYLPSTEVSIHKTDGDSKNIKGALYGIYSDEGCNDLIKEFPLTDDNGHAKVTLEGSISKVYIKEISAPSGFMRDAKVYNKDALDPSTLEIKDEKALGEISVYKRDSATGEKPRGDATLKGAIIGLYAKENITDPSDLSIVYQKDREVARKESDEKGYVGFKNLLPGKYYIREIGAPTGYDINNDRFDVEIKYIDQDTKIETKSIVIEDDIIKAPIIINKTKTGNGNIKIEGAGFSVYLKSSLSKKADGTYDFDNAKPECVGENDSVVMYTDQNGKATSSPLPYGTYVVTETFVPKNYLKADDFEVTVGAQSTNDPIKADVTDNPFTIRIKIDKYDSQSELPIISNRSPATFDIYDIDKDKYVVKDLVVNDKGYVLSDALEAGRYRIEEKSAPYGYEKGEDKEITVDENAITEFDAYSNEEVINVRIYNKPVNTRLEIIKEGEVFKRLDASTDEKGERNIPVYERGGLKGVTFEIYSAQDIYTPDGSIDPNGDRNKVYSKDELIATIISDENGRAVYDDVDKPLLFGKYYILEKETIKGYLKNDVKEEFEMGEDLADRGYTKTIDLYNERQKIKIVAIKTDSESNEALKDAEFLLTAKSDILSDKGDVLIKAGTVLEKAVSNSEGEALFESEILPGEYQIKEIKAPNGYEIPDEEIYIYAEYDKGEEETLIRKEIKNKKIPPKTETSENPPKPKGTLVLGKTAKRKYKNNYKTDDNGVEGYSVIPYSVLLMNEDSPQSENNLFFTEAENGGDNTVDGDNTVNGDNTDNGDVSNGTYFLNLISEPGKKELIVKFAISVSLVMFTAVFLMIRRRKDVKK